MERGMREKGEGGDGIINGNGRREEKENTGEMRWG